MSYPFSDTFNRAFKRLMILEGGYVNDPRDGGGETKFGISKKAYPGVDIPSLTLSRASEIYHRDYWVEPGWFSVWSPLSEILFIFGVHAGVRRAGKVFQRAINGATMERLKVDGRVGPRTLAAMEDADRAKLISAVVAGILKHYASCEGSKTYLRGWVNRLVRCLEWAGNRAN